VQFLCLVYNEPHIVDGMPEAERRAFDLENLAHDQQLRDGGHYISSKALQPAERAMTVRMRYNNMSATDGPFAETKEHLAGFVLIEARDMEEATRLASGFPHARFGSIEVRPIYDVPNWE
jgi:hypothetical protein